MNIPMTRDEAIEFSFALDRTQKGLVTKLQAVDRKRSWRPSEKAMAKASFQKDLDFITELNDRIQRAAQIRGY